MFLKFKVKLAGVGVVNFDSADSIPDEFKHSDNKNAKYAKVAVTRDKDGNLVREQLFISSACIKNGIFKAISGASLSVFDANFRATQFGKPTYLLKGWMQAMANDNFKRKSPVMVGQALEVSGAVPKMSVGSTEGFRSPTSYFSSESVGKTEYDLDVFLDLSAASFLPLDVTLDRLSLPDDIVNSNNFKLSYKKNFGVDLAPVSHFVRISDPSQTPERGIVLGKKEVNQMAKYLYDCISELYIQRSSAYASVSSVSVTLHKHLNDAGVPWNGKDTLNIPDLYKEVGDHSYLERNKGLDALSGKSSSEKEEKKTKSKKEAK